MLNKLFGTKKNQLISKCLNPKKTNPVRAVTKAFPYTPRPPPAPPPVGQTLYLRSSSTTITLRHKHSIGHYIRDIGNVSLELYRLSST